MVYFDNAALLSNFFSIKKKLTNQEKQTSSSSCAIDSENDFLDDVIEGLSATPKWLSCKYFYDQHGSALFDKICETDEYYLTRTELSIMKSFKADIAKTLGPNISLVELGSGSSVKTRVLIESLPDINGYYPVDISEEHLNLTAQTLENDYRSLDVHSIAADFSQPFALPKFAYDCDKVVVYFPGSTIGNLVPTDAVELMRQIRDICGIDGGFLVGIDLKKDPAILNAAYNDKSGVTAEFNLNLLGRINRELDGDFDLSNFKHRAIYNSDKGRMEIFIDSTADQTVSISGNEFEFKENEAVHTEYSHKYSIDGFSSLAKQSGFELRESWTDEKDYFGVLYFEAV